MNKKVKWILIVLGALIFILIIGKLLAGGEEGGIKVSSEKVTKRTIIETVNASGKIYPEVEVKITPDISGEVIELKVQEGDSVKKGQVLARIYADIYATQRDQAAAAVNQQIAMTANSQAQLDALKATMDQAQRNYDRQKQLLDDKIQTQIRKGINPRAMRALIVGIPNVGKSTLINHLAGRKVALTGDRPGVTKGQQWIKMGTEMELLDTPGILWPKFEDENVGLRLAATGAIKETLLQAVDIAFFVIRYIAQHYPEALNERFSMERLPEDLSDPEAVVSVMEDIGRKRGNLLSGGRVDLEKTSMMILRELRAGKMGRISLETPRS